MKTANLPEFNGLRFDSELKSFNDLMSLFLSSAERAKTSGKKLVAKAPLSPIEPIYAAGALAYDSYTHETVMHTLMKENPGLMSKAIDAGLSPDSNPWNLIMTGAIVSKKNEATIDAYATACGCCDDQIKNAWQLMAGADGAPLYFWEVPRFDAESEEWAIKFLVEELKQFFEWLAIQTGHEVTELSLTESIKLGNLLRQDIIEITQMLQLPDVPISALEYYFVQTMIDDYAQDPEILHDRYRALIQELKERVSQTKAAPGISGKPLRIYLMGEETPAFRIWNAIEDYGGVLVGCDTRLSLYYETIREDGSAIENLARWAWRMPCNMPTAERVKATIPFIKQQNPNAIIFSSMIGSNSIPEAEKYTLEIIKDELDIPVLSIETTQPLDNTESIEKQLKSFIVKNTG